MKYKETGFRAIYHQFVIVELNDNIRKIYDQMPGAKEANGILGYGYYDREAGLTVEILAAVRINENSFQYAEGNSKVSLKIRIGAIEDTEFYIIPDEDGKIAKDFADKIKMLKVYNVDEEIEKTRMMQFLDPCRHEFYIDDILVYLEKEGLQTEGCWTRIIGLEDNCLMGILLNEPDQNFGWHEGEKIAFFVHEDEEKIFCFTDMNPSQRITEEDLADGSMLKESVARFNKERNQRNFLDVLEILRDSFVWIPCNAIFSGADTSFVDNTIVVANGDNYFFPIFSSAEEMGEYGENFSKVQKHILEVIPLARNNEKKVAGIVLNAFSEPFVLEAEIFDILEGMKSRIELSKTV